MNPLNAYLAQSVIEDRYAHADAYRRAHQERAQAAALASMTSVTIRRVTPDDWQAVERLAQLEAADAPRGAALLAEVDDRVLAVRSLDDGATVADPFQPTAELVGCWRRGRSSSARRRAPYATRCGPPRVVRRTAYRRTP